MANRVGDLITSSTYNAIRGRVNRILGAGDGGTSGYGVALESVARGGNELITAEDMQALYNDLVKARTHQVGSDLQWSNPNGLNPPDLGEYIGYYAADVDDVAEPSSETYILDWVDTVYPNNSISIYNSAINGYGLRLRIVKTGRIYEVNITQPGQGFTTDDNLTIPGHLVGGSTPLNDIYLEIDAVETGGAVTFFGPGSILTNAKPEQSSQFSSTDANEGFQDYISAVEDIEADVDLIGPGQASTKIVATSLRTTSWSKKIDHRVIIEWNDSEHRRQFFNTGGEIRFNAQLTGGLADPNNVGNAAPPSVKDEIWQSMLENMGTIFFTKDDTYSNGTEGTGFGFGNYSGTQPVDWENTSRQNPVTIFAQDGVGVYSENAFIIEAYQPGPFALVFNIVFNDNDLGDPQNPGQPGASLVGFDEPVTGEVTSTVSVKTITGVLGVPEPYATTISGL